MFNLKFMRPTLRGTADGWGEPARMRIASGSLRREGKGRWESRRGYAHKGEEPRGALGRPSRCGWRAYGRSTVKTQGPGTIWRKRSSINRKAA
jgi:hypothetical protein